MTALALNACTHAVRGGMVATLNGRQRKTLDALFAEPLNGNIEWSRIESLFRALDCKVVSGNGSSITVEKCGARAHFHRPHPGKEALRYRVKDAREFLRRIGAAPG